MEGRETTLSCQNLCDLLDIMIKSINDFLNEERSIVHPSKLSKQ